MSTLATEPREVPCPHCKGTGVFVVPSEVKTVEAYFFGCWEQSGHFWRSAPPKNLQYPEIEKRLGPDIHVRIDTGFCPGVMKGEQYKRSRDEVEGEAALHRVNGWTILSWWDRSVDKRGACNSNVVVLGEHNYATMLEVVRAQFPSLFARRASDIVLVEDAS